jgi:cytochrome c5
MLRIDHIDLLIAALLLPPAAAVAASGEELYKTRCSLCHDGGAGQAPRISDREEWSARLARGREALVQSAIRGVPNSAMTARGGHTDLSDAEVAAAVNYLLDRSGAKPSAAKPAAPARKPAAIVVREDSAVVADVLEALERARILGVKVESLNHPRFALRAGLERFCGRRQYPADRRLPTRRGMRCRTSC